jgi:cellulose biosynthesis protein BcsQ
VPHFLAVEGLENLVQAVARLDFRCQSRTHFLGVVPTIVDLRLRTVRENLQALRASFGAAVFAIEVRTNVRLAEAPAMGGTIFEHDPTSVGADCHRLLAEELTIRLQQALGVSMAPAAETVELGAPGHTAATPAPGTPAPDAEGALVAGEASLPF